jgi:hypothetical protein
MRSLSLHEAEKVSGGVAAEVVVAGALIGISAIWLINSLTPTSPKIAYEPVVSTYDVVTPVYDPSGKYVGDMIDTYSQTDYVPVKVY